MFINHINSTLSVAKELSVTILQRQLYKFHLVADSFSGVKGPPQFSPLFWPKRTHFCWYIVFGLGAWDAATGQMAATAAACFQPLGLLVEWKFNVPVSREGMASRHRRACNLIYTKYSVSQCSNCRISKLNT